MGLALKAKRYFLTALLLHFNPLNLFGQRVLINQKNTCALKRGFVESALFKESKLKLQLYIIV